MAASTDRPPLTRRQRSSDMSAAGIPPSDVVQLAGRSDVFVVVDTDDLALVRLRSEHGAELRAGLRALRWPPQGDAA